MRLKRTSWFVIITFCCFIIGSIFIVAPAQAEMSKTELLNQLVEQMDLVYNCIDEMDKPYMLQARTNAQELADEGYQDPAWKTVLNPLINSMKDTIVGRQALVTLGGEERAREKFVKEFADLSEMYYTNDADELKTKLNYFKAEYRDLFFVLLGDDLEVITPDEFYGLLLDTRDEFKTVLKQDAELSADILFGTDEELIQAMPELIKKAMKSVITGTEYEGFYNRLADIGWTVDMLIDQFKILNNTIDPSNKAKLGLALAGVRSQAELFDLVSDPKALTPIANNAITCTVGDDVSLQLQIMSTDITSKVGYIVDGDAIGITEAQYDTIDFSATSPGTATLVLYRQNGVAEHDWIAKLEVTVTGIYGDVTGEGEITITDAVKVLKHITDGITLNAQEQILGDVNGDDAVTITDAVLVLKHITDPDIPFPVENP